MEFPPLPKRSAPYNNVTQLPVQPHYRTYNNSNSFSYFQPTSNSSNHNSNKKRKLPPTTPPSPMFPFRIGPNAPLPSCTEPPNYLFSAEKDRFLSCISIFVSEFFNKVKSINDIKNINVESIKQDMNVLMEKYFLNNP